MNENVLIELVQKLIEKTEKKEAIWNITSRENEFILNLDNSAITTDKWEDDLGNVLVDISIRGIDGITLFSKSYTKGENNYELFSKLNECAKSSYYKIDETLAELFNKINSDKVIGQPSKSTDIDLDLPF